MSEENEAPKQKNPFNVMPTWRDGAGLFPGLPPLAEVRPRVTHKVPEIPRNAGEPHRAAISDRGIRDVP